jgi:hypothetical protein
MSSLFWRDCKAFRTLLWHLLTAVDTVSAMVVVQDAVIYAV